MMRPTPLTLAELAESMPAAVALCVVGPSGTRLTKGALVTLGYTLAPSSPPLRECETLAPDENGHATLRARQPNHALWLALHDNGLLPTGDAGGNKFMCLIERLASHQDATVLVQSSAPTEHRFLFITDEGRARHTRTERDVLLETAASVWSQQSLRVIDLDNLHTYYGA